MATDLADGFQPRGEGTVFEGAITASGQARQHNGNLYQSTTYQYTVRRRISDESIRDTKKLKHDRFLKAVAEGQAPRVRYFLHSIGVDVDYSDDQGFSAIHHAVLTGLTDVVETLIEAGADVNAESLDYGTPLHLAALKDRSDVADLLIRFKANVNSTSRLAGSPLHCACYSGTARVASALLAAGAVPTKVSTCCPERMEEMHKPTGQQLSNELLWAEAEPLSLVALTENFAIVDLLCQHGASINSVFRYWFTGPHVVDVAFEDPESWHTKSKRTILMHAVVQGDLSVSHKLISRGAHIDVQDLTGETALMIAVGKRNLSMLDLLVSNSASLDYCDVSGFSALMHAVRLRYTDCVQFLAQKGANPDWQARGSKSTALHIAVKAGDVDVTRVLLAKYGVRITEARDSSDMTALHYAAEAGNVDLSLLLVSSGADVNAPYRDRHNAVLVASSSGHADVVHILLEHGADPNGLRQRIPLHLSIVLGHLDVMRELLENGADVNARNQADFTPLHRATFARRKEAVSLLLQHGADTQARCRDGLTALDHARKKGAESDESMPQLDMSGILQLLENESRREEVLIRDLQAASFVSTAMPPARLARRSGAIDSLEVIDFEGHVPSTLMIPSRPKIASRDPSLPRSVASDTVQPLVSSSPSRKISAEQIKASKADRGMTLTTLTDETSYEIPEDGSPIVIPTRRMSGKRKEKGLGHTRQRDQTSLLIEYIEGSTTGDKTKSKGIVRVKVQPSSRKKSGGGGHDTVQVTGIGKDHKLL